MLITIIIQHLFYGTYDFVTDSKGHFARIATFFQIFLIFFGRTRSPRNFPEAHGPLPGLLTS